jgi:hypothetical protein
MIRGNDWYDDYNSIELFYSEKAARAKLDAMGACAYALTIIEMEITE